MATRLIMSPSKSQTGSRSFTKALALAFNEWLLMLMLFANSIFSYVITKFADYTELESPCMMCTRLDLILERTKHSNKSHWDMICSKHKSEISSLVYCHAHGKLVDVRRMCETCLFSFATTNKSNAETYRLLVGKLGEDSSSCFESKTDISTKPRYCTCCNQLWMAQTATQVAKAVAKPDTLAKIRVSGDVKPAKISTPKKSVSFNHLPHVGYTELKIHSDTEEEDHKFETMDIETPRGITLPYDLATDKLLSLDLPLVDRNVREEVHLKEIDLSTNAFSKEKKVLREEEIISLDNLFLTSRAMEDSSLLIHLEDVSSTQVFKEVPTKTLMEETGLISVNSVPDSPVSVSETIERKETSITVSSVSEMASQAVTSHIEEAIESESSSFNSMSVTAETNIGSGEAWVQGGELLDLADAYNNIVHSESNKDSNGGAEIEQWMKKDTSRVSEDLKALLTQISASRGIEFLSPRDISPRMCSDQDTKNLDYDMQMLIQKRMLERNESNLSLEGVSVSEIEGESEGDRLKRQVDHDRKLLTGLYKELEEERSASAVATNQAMAMITRLQEEKSLFQMEALQNLRMMEEQAEYDMEAIQKLNDLLVEREKLIQDLEAEIDYFRDQSSQKNVPEIDSSNERMSNKLQSCLSGFNEERLYITRCLEKIEKRVQVDVKGEANVDNLATQESVSELHERVEKLKGDLYFLEHVVSSLGHGDEGVEFVKEIASHLQTLRSISMKRQEHTET
ncbi:unnamed protein product [Cochlearia groenlandica]